MNILVTGGAGFIGSHLCDRLISADEKHLVHVIDNLSLGKKAHLAHLMNRATFAFYEEDLLDYPAVSRIFERGRFDAVFHLAANSDIAKAKEDPDTDFGNTLMTTYNVLKLMKDHSVRQIVFASSSAVYGETKDRLTEDYGPLLPISHYGAAKLGCEAFISSFVENYDISACIVRFPNVVGERATHGVIYDFINKLKTSPDRLVVMGDGEQCKPYMYVEDLIEAMLYVWKTAQNRRNVFNVGVETRTKVKDIARMVIAGLGLRARISYTGGNRGWVGDVPEFNYDLTKIHRLGWTAKRTSDEAVELAIRKIISSL